MYDPEVPSWSQEETGPLPCRGERTILLTPWLFSRSYKVIPLEKGGINQRWTESWCLNIGGQCSLLESTLKDRQTSATYPLACTETLSPWPWVCSTLTVQRFTNCWYTVTDSLTVWKCKSTHLNGVWRTTRGPAAMSSFTCGPPLVGVYSSSEWVPISWLDSSSQIWL